MRLLFTFRHLTSVLLLLTIAVKPQALELKPSITEYKASFKGGIPITGTATRSLEQLANNVWRYHFDVDSLLANINESVYFQWDGEKIIPITYHYRRSGWAVSDRTATLEFNWNRLKVLNDVQGKPWSMPIPEGAMDKLGYQLQIRLDLLNEKPELNYQVADGGLLKRLHFKRQGEGPLETELGTITAVSVMKVPSETDNRRTTLWFAKEWDYLLVKLVQIEADGERYEINLESATLGDKIVGQ